MADDANSQPVKSGTISQICLKKDNTYYDVCDTTNREKVQEINNTFLDKTYPVGSVYMTMDNNFNPATSFGGVWEKIQGKFLLATSGNEVSNETGGRSQVTLTDKQVPLREHSHPMSHTHS